jgi:hypothetical protein
MNVPKTGHCMTRRPSLRVFREDTYMIKLSIPGRGPVRSLVRAGLAAAALLALSAASGQHAHAMSLINPGAAPVAKVVSGALTTEVAGHSGGSGHGGGGHGAGFGGAAFGTSAVIHGGGLGHRHHFHRPFFYGGSYYLYDDYPYYYPYRRCRVVLTDYGPRRICHFRHRRIY